MAMTMQPHPPTHASQSPGQRPCRQLRPLSGSEARNNHVRNHLAAAQYFQEHNIREHLTSLTQMLMIHQPADALTFMQEQLGRLIEERDSVMDRDYSSAVGKGACLIRVQARYEGPEGSRTRTFTRLLPADDKSMRHRAETEAAHTVRSVVWDEDGAHDQPEPLFDAFDDRLAQIAEEERKLESERRILENQLNSTKRPVMTGNVPPVPLPASAPDLSGFETGVLMCTYAAEGKKKQLEDLITNGVCVNTADYDKRTALHLASSEGHVDVVECLLALNANVNATDRMGFSPLVDACRHGHLQVQTLLRNAGGEMLGTEVSIAVVDDVTASVQYYTPRKMGSEDDKTVIPSAAPALPEARCTSVPLPAPKFGSAPAAFGKCFGSSDPVYGDKYGSAPGAFVNSFGGAPARYSDAFGGAGPKFKFGAARVF